VLNKSIVNIAMKLILKYVTEKTTNIRRVESVLHSNGIEIPIRLVLEIDTEKNHRKYRHS
jgi:hypothetical protein